MNIGVITNVGKVALSTASRVGHVVIQHGPEICVGAGIVGGVTTTVMACRATLKVNEICIENQPIYDKINACLECEEITEDQYNEEDAKKDRLALVSYTSRQVVKYYGPVVLLGAASVASILCGVKILNQRNMALVAAYTTLDAGYKTYRHRVIEELGEDADYRFRTGSVQKKIEDEVVDEKTGEIKTKKVKADVLEPGVEPLDYTINFCKDAIHVTDRKDLKRSESFIQSCEDSLNLTLKAQRYLTLNQARVSLGVPEIWFGQIVGWTMDGTGDCEVHLDRHRVYDEELGQYTIIIDPNVEGPMFHKIGGMIDG